MTTRTLQDVLEAAGSADGPDPSWAELDVPAGELARAIDEARDMAHRDLSGSLARATVLRAIADARGDLSARANARAALGHALNYANRFDEARAVAGESAMLAQQAGDPFAEGRARMTIVHACARQGRWHEGLSEAERARALFERAGDAGWVARAETNAAVLLRMSGDLGRSIDLFRRALGHGGLDGPSSAQVRNNLAEALLDAGRFEEAEGEFRKACELLIEAQAWRLAAIGRGNLADLLGRQGRLAEALQEFESARRFFERDAAAGEHGRILIEQADVLRVLGETDEAERAYRRAIQMVSQAGLRAEHARALLGLGSLLIAEAPAEAGRVLHDARMMTGELGNKAQLALVDLARARSLLAAGRPGEARRIAESIQSAYGPGRVEWALARSLACRALTAEGAGAAAATLASEALDRAELSRMPVLKIELLAARAAASLAAGDRASALADLRACCEDTERARGSLGFDRHRVAITHSRRDAYESLVRLLTETSDGRDLREAFEVCERARCRGWLEQLESGGDLPPDASGTGDAELLGALRRHRQSLTALYSRLDPAGTTPSDATLTDRIEAEEGAMLDIERRLASSRAGAGFSLRPAGCDAIASCLGEREALVAYWQAGDGLLAFVLRREGLRVARCEIDPAELAELTAATLFQIRRGLSRGGSPDRRRAGAERALRSMGEAVWDPVERLGVLEGVDQLAIVPTGPLHAAPFAAVIGPAGPLVERFEIAMLPSCELLPVLRARSCPAGHPVLVGVPDLAAPAIRDEIRTIRGAFGSAESLEDADATWERVRSASGDARLLHIACHGSHRPNAPLASALRLADRWVTARDIMELDLPGSVVVLSGCDTGRMDAAFGDEVHGLTRAFVAAGASALVTALWPAHDAATGSMMERIYIGAGPEGVSGARVRRSLARTQRSELRAGLHPALWAHLIYVGG